MAIGDSGRQTDGAGASVAISAVVAAVITPLVGAATQGTDDAAKLAAALALG